MKYSFMGLFYNQFYILVFIFSINVSDIMNEIVELGRRLKRSLDGYITYRKIAVILALLLFFFLYLAPGVLRWISGQDRVSTVI